MSGNLQVPVTIRILRHSVFHPNPTFAGIGVIFTTHRRVISTRHTNVKVRGDLEDAGGGCGQGAVSALGPPDKPPIFGHSSNADRDTLLTGFGQIHQQLQAVLDHVVVFAVRHGVLNDVQHTSVSLLLRACRLPNVITGFALILGAPSAQQHVFQVSKMLGQIHHRCGGKSLEKSGVVVPHKCVHNRISYLRALHSDVYAR